MATLRLVTDIAAPPEVCFDLSRSIDLHLESMAASRERAVGGVTSGLIGLGQTVTWEARHFGIRWRMTSRISEYAPPHRFVDEMVRGPFRTFRHEHTFEPTGDSGLATRMTDAIEFTTWGWFVADPPVGAYLRRLIRVRNNLIRRRAES